MTAAAATYIPPMALAVGLRARRYLGPKVHVFVDPAALGSHRYVRDWFDQQGLVVYPLENGAASVGSHSQMFAAVTLAKARHHILMRPARDFCCGSEGKKREKREQTGESICR